jgi:hypothetical protein
MYASDGACDQSLGETTQTTSSSQFDVWVGRTSSTFAVGQEYVNASASWDEEPIWRVPIDGAKVAAVFVDRPQQSYSRYLASYPVNAHALYILQTGALPEIGGPDPLNPFFFERKTGRVAKPQKMISLSGVHGETRAQIRANGAQIIQSDDRYYGEDLRIGEVSFTLSEAWQGSEGLRQIVEELKKHKRHAHCYQGPLLNRAAVPTLDWFAAGSRSECMYDKGDKQKLLTAGKLSIPIMFHISGGIDGTKAKTQYPGKIVVLMTWKSASLGSGIRKLGGRLISVGGSGDFLVRGANWTDIDDDVEASYKRGGYEDEIKLHGDLGLVPIDATVSLKFFLSSSDGSSVSWHGDTLKLFYPTFKGVREVFD